MGIVGPLWVGKGAVSRHGSQVKSKLEVHDEGHLRDLLTGPQATAVALSEITDQFVALLAQNGYGSISPCDRQCLKPQCE